MRALRALLCVNRAGWAWLLDECVKSEREPLPGCCRGEAGPVSFPTLVKSEREPAGGRSPGGFLGQRRVFWTCVFSAEPLWGLCLLRVCPLGAHCGDFVSCGLAPWGLGLRVCPLWGLSSRPLFGHTDCPASWLGFFSLGMLSRQAEIFF